MEAWYRTTRQEVLTCGVTCDRRVLSYRAKIFQPICCNCLTAHLPLFYDKSATSTLTNAQVLKCKLLVTTYAHEISNATHTVLPVAICHFCGERPSRECSTHFNIASAESLGPVVSDTRIHLATMPQHFPESGARLVLNSVKLDGIAILKFQQRICKCQLSTLIVRVARGKFMHLH